ncbi:MAG: HAD-IA family hydrolase [Nitrospiraceae bacterium]|nr:HAD-IA family hydrolase [Nitrospiraceae bacterium]
MPISLFIFDLDGTLIDTLTDITNSLNYAFGRCGLKSRLTEKQVKGIVGEGIGKLIEKAIQRDGSLTAGPAAADAAAEGSQAEGAKDGRQLAEDLTREFLAHYRKHLLDHTQTYPGVPETLKNLKGFKKAIITNKRVPLTMKILEGLDLAEQFDLVVGPETAGERKPSPEPVFYVLKKLNSRPEEAVVVGDSRFDIEAGRKAGVKCTVAVTYGYGNRQAPVKEADYLIDSIEDLLPTLYKNEPMLERRATPRD